MGFVENLSFKKTYTLKAQTPIIHFQHNQSGATLRATEVKPKLDRFICKNYRDKIKSEWFVTADKNALKYKLHFDAKGEQSQVDLGFKTDYDIYYANMGDNTLKKKGVIGDVAMTVVCTIPSLMSIIEECIAEFFAVTNFGTMQNKGFGSYIVEEEKAKYTPKFIADSLKKTCGSDACYMYRPRKAVFKSIKVMYGMMKAGVNYTRFRGPNAYQRSLLFLYMHTDEYRMGNEKAWMKQNKIAPIVSTSGKKWHENPENQEAFYVRALLGVGEHIEFQANPGRVKVTIENADKGSDSKKIIERFSSPVYFKVIGSMVYISAKRIDDNIYGKTFRFSSDMGTGTLRVPEKDQLPSDFIDRFLKYCIDNINETGADKFDDTRGIRVSEV